MTRDEFEEHIHASYYRLRIGLAVLAFLFPLILWGGGLALGISLQHSMSDYYFGFPKDSRMRWFPMRIAFVGILWAIGCFLILYKGYSHAENRILNFAGFGALIVAIIHTAPPDGCDNCAPFTWQLVHYIGAGVVFGGVALVAWACSETTLLKFKGTEEERNWYRKWYRRFAIGMILAPGIALLIVLAMGKQDSYVFFLELVGIWFFGAFWILKTRELSANEAELRMMKGEMTDGVQPPTTKEQKAPRMKVSKTLDAFLGWEPIHRKVARAVGMRK